MSMRTCHSHDNSVVCAGCDSGAVRCVTCTSQSCLGCRDNHYAFALESHEMLLPWEVRPWQQLGTTFAPCRAAEDELMTVADEKDKLAPQLEESRWRNRQLEKDVQRLQTSSASADEVPILACSLMSAVKACVPWLLSLLIHEHPILRSSV